MCRSKTELLLATSKGSLTGATNNAMELSLDVETIFTD